MNSSLVKFYIKNVQNTLETKQGFLTLKNYYQDQLNNPSNQFAKVFLQLSEEQQRRIYNIAETRFWNTKRQQEEEIVKKLLTHQHSYAIQDYQPKKLFLLQTKDFTKHFIIKDPPHFRCCLCGTIIFVQQDLKWHLEQHHDIISLNNKLFSQRSR